MKPGLVDVSIPNHRAQGHATISAIRGECTRVIRLHVVEVSGLSTTWIFLVYIIYLTSPSILRDYLASILGTLR